MRSHDVIVVGLGAHGSATLYQLAKRGVSAVGIDRFDPPHEMGSSHGESRGTYEAGGFGSAHHVPFSRRTFELWRELEQESETKLFLQHGILIMGIKGGQVAEGTLSAASNTGATYEVLDAPEIRRRFPAFTPEDDIVGIFQPKGGVMRVEPIIRLQLQLASARGAVVHTNQAVTGWTANSSGVEIATTRDTYRAQRLVIAAGPYLPGLVDDLPVPIHAERQVLMFWNPKANPEHFALERLPVWMYESRGQVIAYGVPDIGSGVKTAIHYVGTVTDPETVDRSVSEADIAPVRDLLQKIQPDVLGEFRRGVVCLYTCTPDYDFIVDKHPNHDNVIIASICSSQGFKYSGAFGEALAELAVDGRTSLDISPWRLSRFTDTT